MKKVIYFIIGIGFLAGTCAQAQFEVGQRFGSGMINLGATGHVAERPVNSTSSYNHSFGISLGKFTRENRAVGWSFANGLRLQDRNNFSPKARSLQSFTLGVGRFVEFYKPLGQKWALYLRPSVSADYRLENSYIETPTSQPDGTRLLASQNRLQQVFVSGSLGAGVLWRFAPKWALHGNVLAITPLSIALGRTHQEVYNGTSGAVENKNSGYTVEYAVRPTLSVGSVGLGFRYFY